MRPWNPKILVIFHHFSLQGNNGFNTSPLVTFGNKKEQGGSFDCHMCRIEIARELERKIKRSLPSSHHFVITHMEIGF
jgi:hypothetical protein